MYSVFRNNIRTLLIKIVLVIRRITTIRDSGTSGTDLHPSSDHEGDAAAAICTTSSVNKVP